MFARSFAYAVPSLFASVLIVSAALAQETEPLPRDGTVEALLLADQSDGAVEQREVTRQHPFVVEDAGERWLFDLESRAFDAYLYLLDDQGRVVAFDDDGGVGLNARLMHAFEQPGTYRLAATSFGGRSEGPYTLRSTALGVAGPPAPVFEGQPLHDQLEAGDTVSPLDGRRSVARMHELRVEEAGERWLIDLESDMFDAYLYVLREDGSVLTFDDDGGEGLNSRLVHSFSEPGTYLLVATSFGGTSTGRYTLRARTLPPAGNLVAEPLPRGGIIEDLLVLTESHGPALEDRDAGHGRVRTVTRRHVFEAEAGEHWRFFLGSEAFDAYLYLLDPDGRMLAFDDDGGGNLDSLIVHHFDRSGPHILVVTSFSGTSEGPYRLSAREMRPGPPPIAPITPGQRTPLAFGDDAGLDEQGRMIVGLSFEIEEPSVVFLRTDDAPHQINSWLMGPGLLPVVQPGQVYGSAGGELTLTDPGMYLFYFAAGAVPEGTVWYVTVDIEPLSGSRRTLRPLAFGEWTEATITDGDARHGQSWSVDGQVADVLTVHLRSDALGSLHEPYFAPIGRVESPSGVVAREIHLEPGQTEVHFGVELFESGRWIIHLAPGLHTEDEADYAIMARRYRADRLRSTRLRPGRTRTGDLGAPTYWDLGMDGPADLYHFRGRAGERIILETDADSPLSVAIMLPHGEQLGQERGAWMMPGIDWDAFWRELHHDPWMDHGMHHPPFDDFMLDESFGLGGEIGEDEGPLVLDLPLTGRYVVRVIGREATAGPYSLRIVRHDAVDGAARPLELGASVDHRLRLHHPIGEGGALLRRYRFELDEPRTVTFRATHGDEPPVELVLTSADGQQADILAMDSEDGEASLSTLLLPGTWVLTVLQRQRLETAFTLSSVEEEPRALAPRTISPGSALEGDMAEARLDDPMRMRPAIPVMVRLEPQQAVRVTLRSGDFDAYLVMSNALGAVVASDDDSGGGLDAQFDYTSTLGGAYLIWVTSFGGSTRGHWTLTVRDQP
ncbi:MAG: hypothetical protein EA398_05310 [Deltaproteobacteria bacterium]|nr:MAG: hypothetical protein EA398_05310 [Deltaproteobacteria bacterium]